MATGYSIDPEHPCGLWDKDINTDPGCSRAIDLGTAFISSPEPDSTIAPGDSVGHSERHGTSGGMTLKH